MEEIVKDLRKYIAFSNKSENFSNENEYKWHKGLADKINMVLNELDNRIPREKIEAQIKQLDLIDEYEALNGWEPEREYARDILKDLLNKE